MDRAASAVQRLLAAARRLSATGSASPPPDRTSWPGVLRRAFSPRHFGLVLLIPWAAWVPKNLARRKMASALRRFQVRGQLCANSIAPGGAVAHLVLLISGALTSPVALNARARAFPKLSRAGAADRFGSGRRRGAAAAGGGQEALSYGVSFATTRSHQLARGSPACVLAPAFRAGSLDPLGRVGAEESGATKNGFGAATLSGTGSALP